MVAPNIYKLTHNRYISVIPHPPPWRALPTWPSHACLWFGLDFHRKAHPLFLLSTPTFAVYLCPSFSLCPFLFVVDHQRLSFLPRPARARYLLSSATHILIFIRKNNVHKTSNPLYYVCGKIWVGKKMFHQGNAVEEVGCHESEFDDRYKGLCQ